MQKKNGFYLIFLSIYLIYILYFLNILYKKINKCFTRSIITRIFVKYNRFSINVYAVIEIQNCKQI
jgi:hypothetical protein